MKRERTRNSISVGWVIWLFVFTGLAARADDTKPAPPSPSGPMFRATLNDGTTVSGPLRQLDMKSGVIAIEGPKNLSWKPAQVFSLEREGGDPPPSLPEGSMIVFPEGDRLRALIGATTDSELQVRSSVLGDEPLAVRLESILGTVLAPPADADAVEALWTRVRTEKRDADVLWLANGDRLTGSLLAITPEKIEFQPDTGPVSLPRASAIAVGADPATVKYPRPSGAFLDLIFTDGSRLGVTDARLAAGKIVARTRFGAEISPEVKMIDSLHVRSDAVVYLSDRKADAAQFVGYLGKPPANYGRDTTWDGHLIRLARRPHDRGLGTLPRTLLAYRLDAHDRVFQAIVGQDDRAGDLGNVVFRVLVDGQERFNSQAMVRHTAPLPVKVDLTGAKLLILITEFGERGDVQDVADWADARIVRSE